MVFSKDGQDKISVLFWNLVTPPIKKKGLIPTPSHLESSLELVTGLYKLPHDF